MSPVTPNPAAEFSTLAMTKSSDSRSMRAGTARRAISRPGFPKMSPMNRMRMSANGDPDLIAAAIGDAWQHDTQLAVDQRGRGAAGIERAVHGQGACEAAERTFGHVKGGILVPARRGQLPPRNEQDIAGKHDVDVGHGDAGDVEQHFDRLRGLDDVHRW